MRAKVFIACLLWLLAINQVSAQNSLHHEKKHRLFFITEIGYLSGTGKVTVDNADLSNEGIGARLRFNMGYRINDHFSAGIGFGLKGYHEPAYNTFPVFVDVRGYLRDTKVTPFAYLDLGYAVPITDKFESGLLTNFGIGYRLYFEIFKRGVYFLPSAGFNLQKVKRDRQVISNGQFPPQLVTIEDNFTVKSFSINLGVEF